ncbi:hypothetical protein C5167_016770 [Papaver somniferum]|nr:hypothetical protein C5167_016770 [Papaver somniferum]
MLVWDDTFDIMGVHDEDTFKYFDGTQVNCVLCPRDPDIGGSIIQDIEIQTMFTHHQKTVIADSEVPSGGSEKRRIVSFIGGIDLCDGRYDTQFHSLFRTLDTAHHDDFYQHCFTGSKLTKGGPREPWHDIHSRLRYPIGITSDGNVTELPGFEFFPDTNGRVLGAQSIFLPPILTT